MEELELSNPNPKPNPNTKIDRVYSATPRDLLAIAFRRRRLMIISFLGVLFGAILVAVLQPNRYEAGMKILVKRERVDPVITSEASVQPQPVAPGLSRTGADPRAGGRPRGTGVGVLVRRLTANRS